MEVDPPAPPTNSSNGGSGNLPGPTPKTLEQDLFGDEATDPSLLTSRAPAVIAREEGDMDDLPTDGTMGRLEVSKTRDADEQAKAMVQAAEDDDEGLDDADGLFGDDDDEEDEPMAEQVKEFELPTPILPGQEGMTAEEQEYYKRLEYEEEGDDTLGQEQVVESLSVAQIELANFGLPAYNKVWHTKLPSFLALKQQPFDSLLWDPDDDVVTPAAAAAAAEGGGGDKERPSIVPDEYVMRWRWAKDKDGNPVKESNSRFVRWSDGSVSLQIGSELFDVSASIDHSALRASSSAASTNGAHPPPLVPASTGNPLASDLSTFAQAPGHGTTFVIADHLYSGLLETQASVHGSLAITPTNLQSATHRRLAGSIARRYEQKDRIKLAITEEDPERKRIEREKAEMDRQRKLKAKLRQQRATKTGRKQARRATKLDYGDDSEGEPMDEDGDGDDDDNFGDSRRSQPKRGKGGPLAREEEEDEDADGFVVDSGDEEEAQEEAEYSEDEMDAIEQNIEREERRRKEAARAKQQQQKKERSASPPPAAAPRRRLVVEDDEDE